MELSYSKERKVYYPLCQAVIANQSRRLVVSLIGSVNTDSALMSSLNRTLIYSFFYKTKNESTNLLADPFL